MRLVVRVLALALFACSPLFVFEAQAGQSLDEALQARCWRVACTIRNNPGGDVEVFQAAAQEVLDEGKRLIIDGFCASACVILADLARNNTCITARAQMAVHKASVIEVTGKATVKGREVPVGNVIRREDPPQSGDINRWVRAHGGYPYEGVMIIPLKDAQKFWAMCE